jgi:hypothetical protein
MRIPVFLFVLFASACASAAPEQPSPATEAPQDIPTVARLDRNTVAGCIDLHHENVRGCIGVLSRACGETYGEGGATTGALVQCAMREERVWRGLIADAAEDLRQRESPSQTALLNAALSEGERWSEVRCAFNASIYEGGSLARVVAAQCLRDTAAERALDLHERLLTYDQ